MKKVYTKPEVLFESFASSTGIATGCEDEVNAAKGVCAYVMTAGSKSWNIFDSSIALCTTNEGNLVEQGLDPQWYNQICYDVPTGGMALFGS